MEADGANISDKENTMNQETAVTNPPAPPKVKRGPAIRALTPVLGSPGLVRANCGTVYQQRPDGWRKVSTEVK